MWYRCRVEYCRLDSNDVDLRIPFESGKTIALTVIDLFLHNIRTGGDTSNLYRLLAKITRSAAYETLFMYA